MSIGEVLAILKPEFADITVSKIRFLEGAGLVQPDRSASGYRKFSEDDVARLRFVLRAKRDQYLPLRVIRQRLTDLEQVGGLAARGGAAGDPDPAPPPAPDPPAPGDPAPALVPDGSEPVPSNPPTCSRSARRWRMTRRGRYWSRWARRTNRRRATSSSENLR